MARLPQPGGDNGNWGDILNDFLLQALKPNGLVKDNAVTANTLAPNSVTNAAIASDAVNATSIADGSITNALLANDTVQEAKLDSALRAKLNAGTSSPDWNSITNKPVVIGAGADQATARAAIGAGISNLMLAGSGTATTAAKSDHTHAKADVGLGNVDNTADSNKPVSSAMQTALDVKIDKNTAITGATKTRITYDADGLVVAGVDATTADIADSTDKRYMTDAQQTLIGNTSGTNTGDQDLSGFVLTSRTVNGHALSTDVSVTQSDVGLSNVDNTSDATKNSATATLTNKTISGSVNTVTNIAESSVTNLVTDLAAKATDSNTVHKTGTETIAGQKTFTSSTTVGDGTSSAILNISGNAYNGVFTNVYSDTGSPYSLYTRYMGTAATPTQVTTSQTLGTFGFRGANENGAANNQDAVRIAGIAEENITSTGQRSALIMYTAPSYQISPYERFRISGTGNVSIGGYSTDTSLFLVARNSGYARTGWVATNGTTTLTGTVTTFTNTFRVGDTINVTGETSRIITAIASDTSLTVSVAFSTTASTLAYTVIAAGNLFNVRTNGNVGINQSNPQARLHFGASTAAADGIMFGTDTNLYRSAAGTVKTDNSLVIGTPGITTGSAVTIDGTQTLTNKTLTNPNITSIKDNNGNLILGFGVTANAVNYLSITNEAASGTPGIYAAGTDTNTNINIGPKGSGHVIISTSSGQTPTLRAGGPDTNTNFNIITKGTGVLQANGVNVPTISSTDILTNKTLTSPVLNGIPTGSGVMTTATASTLATRDAAANLYANNLIGANTSTVTAAGTTTLVISSPQIQIFTGTTTQTVTLPTTSVPVGISFTFINQSTGAITINASGGANVTSLTAGVTGQLIALVAAPTLATDWYFFRQYTAASTGGAANLALRDGNANLLADNFVAGFETTVSAAGTTTLTVDSKYQQYLTGTLTHTHALPTTSVIQGMSFRLTNKSIVSWNVSASGGGGVAVIGSGESAIFTANQATPTTAAHWDVAFQPLYRSATSGVIASSIAVRDGNASLTANGFIPSFVTTATAAGTTTLTASSASYQEFTGTTTQTIVLPTTSIAAGQSFTIVNNSSGVITVNASGGATITSINGNSRVATFTSLITTPTTAAHWTYSLASASVIAQSAAVGSLAQRDVNASITATSFIPSATTTATAGGNTTLTAASSEVQIFTGTLTQNVLLPSTGISAGMVYRIINLSTSGVIVQTSTATNIITARTGTISTFRANVATPTAFANWTIEAWPATTAPSTSTTAIRDVNGNLSAVGFIPSSTSTATAAGTTTLTVVSTQIQEFTGTTTQTVALPTTGVGVGQTFTFVNKSTGTVQVNASAGGGTVTLTGGANFMVTLFANVATPTLPTHWTVGPTIPINLVASSSASASTLALRTGNANLAANSFNPSATSTATAAGTTTLTVSSTQVQIFTGTTTQTVVLPSTSVTIGYPYRIINTSTGAVTVQASAGATITTLAANSGTDFTALTATPTTPAGWYSASVASGNMNTSIYDVAGIAEQVVGIAATQTLTNKTLGSPKIDVLKDSNGSTSLSIGAIGSAVNNFYLTNQSAGNYPTFGTEGSSTDIGITFAPKNAGPVRIFASTGYTPTIDVGGPDANIDLNLRTQGSGAVKANGNSVAVVVSPPATSTSSGTPGQIAYDSSYMYICTATNTWKRTALTTW